MTQRWIFSVILIVLMGCYSVTSRQGGQNHIQTLLEPPNTEDHPVHDRSLRLFDLLERYKNEELFPEKLQIILVNLERWESLPLELEDSYVEVNIPAFTVSVFNQGTLLKRFRSVVGKASQPTPILRSAIEYVELNPYWEVPQSIARNEILPKLVKDSQYLTNNHMELFSTDGVKLDATKIDWESLSKVNFNYHIHQKPGAWNAVGSLKFGFPNKYGVFLHGTPHVSLFEEQARTFSHGCIRIEEPLGLAEFALQGTEWTKNRIEEFLKTGKTKRIVLPKPLPIYLNYWTIWVEEEGTVGEAKDVYGIDHRMLQRSINTK